MYCKRCGARLQEGMIVCPECGARQRRRTRTVRCARCGGRASVEMTICPHCGRNLRPAGPRWLLWLAGLLLVITIGLWAVGRLPVERIRQEAARGRERLAGLVQVAELASPTPVSPTPRPPTATPTRTPTITPSRTPTAVPRTATPTITASPEQARTYTVQSGDSLEIIGAKLGVPWQAIAAENGISANTMLQIGQKLRLPAPTAAPSPRASATPTPTRQTTGSPAPGASPTLTSATVTATATQPASTATPAASPGVTIYRVQAGDTLAEIGLRFGVAWEAIAAANKITADTPLQVGQELVIPPAGAPAPPTAAPRPRPTATPAPPTATSTPSLPAPLLTNPGDGTPFSGDGANIVLEWQAVPGFLSGAEYQITVRYLAGGSLQTRTWRTPLTSTRAPLWLWGLADQPARQYTWFVTVVQVTTDGKGGERVIPLSQPSQPRSFTWN